MDINIEREDRNFPLLLGHLKVTSGNVVQAFTVMYPTVNKNYQCEEYDINAMEIKHAKDGTIKYRIGNQNDIGLSDPVCGINIVDGTFNFINDNESVDSNGIKKIVPFKKKNVSVPFSYIVRSNTEALQIPGKPYRIGSVSDMRIVVDRYYDYDVDTINTYAVKLGWTSVTSSGANTTSVWNDASTELVLKVKKKDFDERTSYIDVYFIMKPVLMEYEKDVCYTVVNCALCAENAEMMYNEVERNFAPDDIQNDPVFRDIISSGVYTDISSFDPYYNRYLDILESLSSKNWYYLNGPCTMLIDRDQKTYSKVVFDMDSERRGI